MANGRERTPEEALRRITPLRIAALVVTGVALSLLFPSIVATLSEFPRLRELAPQWMFASAMAEALSFVCVWWLLRIALRTKQWFAVATAQLTSNAVGQALPAGAAAGAAVQYKMLNGAGIDAARAGSGIAATAALQYATLFALPVIALPLVAGSGASQSLVDAAWLGLAVFIVVMVFLAVVLFTDRAPEHIGQLLQWVRNRVVRHGPPVTDLPQQLRKQRDLIRRELGEHWRPALLAAVGNWALDYAALLFALAAVGSEPDPALVLLAYSASAVLRMIPITPGGLGFVEAGLTATLALAGVSAGDALLATLQYRLVSYWLPLLAGPIAGVLYHRRFRDAATT